MHSSIKVKDKLHLKQLIPLEIALKGIDCDLIHLDISNVNDLSHLFYNSKFNGDISKWDTSKVTDMKCMFKQSFFNGDISNWNTSKVESIECIFQDCSAPKPYWSQYEGIQERSRVISEFNQIHREKQHLIQMLP